MKWPTFAEVSTALIALVIVVCSFYGLLNAATEGSKAIYGGLIGSVATYYFTRQSATQATQHVITAQNNGLEQMRQGVARLEARQAPTTEQTADLTAKH